MFPLVFLISPIKPCNKLVFPLPTGPTTATNIPLGISIVMSLIWNTRSSASACSLAFSSRAFSDSPLAEIAATLTFVLCLEEWNCEENLLWRCCVLAFRSPGGGGVSQVNVAPLTSMATRRSSSTVCVFSSNSASNTSESRTAALAASAMELKEIAVRDRDRLD